MLAMQPDHTGAWGRLRTLRMGRPSPWGLQHLWAFSVATRELPLLMISTAGVTPISPRTHSPSSTSRWCQASVPRRRRRCPRLAVPGREGGKGSSCGPQDPGQAAPWVSRCAVHPHSLRRESEHSPNTPILEGSLWCPFHTSATSTPLTLPWKDNDRHSLCCQPPPTRDTSRGSSYCSLERGFPPQGLRASLSPPNAGAPLDAVAPGYLCAKGGCSPERPRGSQPRRGPGGRSAFL